MTASATAQASPHAIAVSPLARREVRHYALHPLFWVGTILLAAQVLLSTVNGEGGMSSTLTMIAPAALLGLLGLIIMTSLAKRSDRAAAATGAPVVPERVRTRALATAILVPGTVALVWFAWAVVYFFTDPPDSFAFPHGPVSTAYVLAVIFALGVVPAAGGPLLGLLLSRWLPQRGMAALALVLVVVVSILMQGNFESTWSWKAFWPWTYWYGPLGWSSGTGTWVATPGSPVAWIGYLAALCALGLQLAIVHDPESDRARLKRGIAITLVVAAVALALTLTLGLPDAYVNPNPGPEL